METKMEIRAFDFEVRAEENERGKTITGQPIIYKGDLCV
jgi:hypothetical protein